LQSFFFVDLLSGQPGANHQLNEDPVAILSCLQFM